MFFVVYNTAYSGHRDRIQSVAETEKYELVVANSRQGIVILKPCVVRIDVVRSYVLSYVLTTCIVRVVIRQVVVLKYEGEASG